MKFVFILKLYTENALILQILNSSLIKIVNIFGGDADSTGGSDLFSFENQKYAEGEYKNEFGNKTRASDRLQMDAGYLAAGLSFGMKGLFSAGATFQNVTGDTSTVGAFAGLNAVENLTLNAGYIYNDTDTDYIPVASKNAISFTAGYNFKELGLVAAADVIAAIGESEILYVLCDIDRIAVLTGEITENITSANSIEKVKILAGQEKPIRIEVEMSGDVGFFQIEEVLLQKVNASPARSLIEFYAGVISNEMKRYL